MNELDLIGFRRRLEIKAVDLLLQLCNPLLELRLLAFASLAAGLKQTNLPQHQTLELRLTQAPLQRRRNGDPFQAVAFRFQPALPRGQFVEALRHHGKVGACDRFIEPDHDIAGADPIAVAGENLAHHASCRMLNLLDVTVDHDRSGRDNRSGQLRHHGPAAKTAHKKQCG